MTVTQQPLTPKQKMVLDVIKDKIAANEVAPTYREIGEALGLYRATIAAHVEKLVAKGYITKSRGWHSIKLVESQEDGPVDRSIVDSPDSDPEC
jgi:DNA-binding MarR family transcriptional regulator